LTSITQRPSTLSDEATLADNLEINQ